MQRYDYSNICKPLTKWQRRHLYMSSLLLWYSQRYFVAKLDVCSTEYPAQMLLDEKYEEKGRGEGLYGGGSVQKRYKLEDLENCPWIKFIAGHITDGAVTSASNTSQPFCSMESGSSPKQFSLVGDSMSGAEDVVDSDESQFLKMMPMLGAAALFESNNKSSIPYLQLICACAEAFPRGECWSSNNQWRRRQMSCKESKEQPMVKTLPYYRNFASPRDTASVVFSVTEVLASCGGAGGDRATQSWSLLALLKLTTPSALICLENDTDPSVDVLCAVWCRAWDTLFRPDLQYSSYTACAFPTSAGEMVLMLLTLVARFGLIDPTLLRMIHQAKKSDSASKELLSDISKSNLSSILLMKQKQVWNLLPVFKNPRFVLSGAVFDLVATLLRHSGLTDDGTDVFQDPTSQHVNLVPYDVLSMLRAYGRRFRLLDYCLSFIEAAIQGEEVESMQTILPFAGICLSAIIGDKCDSLVSSYSIETVQKNRIIESSPTCTMKFPGEKSHFSSGPFRHMDLWKDSIFPPSIEDFLENDDHLLRILSGRGAQFFSPSSVEDLRCLSRQCYNVDFVPVLMTKNMRSYAMSCMRQYIYCNPAEEIGVESDVQSDSDTEQQNCGDEEKASISHLGRLAVTKLFVAIVFSGRTDDISVVISDLSEIIAQPLDDAIDQLKFVSLRPTELFHLATDLLGIFRALLHISSTGCSAVYREFGDKARHLYEASKFVLNSYIARSDNISTRQTQTPNANTVSGHHKNDFDDSDDERNPACLRQSFNSGSNDDPFDSDGPQLKRAKRSSLNTKRRRHAATDSVGPASLGTKGGEITKFLPDAKSVWICASIMSILSPSSECCREVIDYLVYPEELDDCDGREIAEPNPLDCAVCLHIFCVDNAILRHKRLELFLNRQRKSAALHGEEQSVFSQCTHVIFQSRTCVGPASPFNMYGFDTCSRLLQIDKLNVDSRECDDIIDALYPEGCRKGNKHELRHARRALKTRPHVRLRQLRAATKAFCYGNDSFHEKFDNIFAALLVLPSLKDMNHKVRCIAADAVACALQILPNQQVIVESVLKSLIPLIKAKDEDSLIDSWYETQITGKKDLFYSMERDAWRDSRPSLECTAIECLGAIAGATTDIAVFLGTISDIIDLAMTRPDLQFLCFRACERASLMKGFSSVDDMFLDHKLEWLLQKWLDSGQKISEIPLFMSCPWMVHSLLRVQPSQIIQKATKMDGSDDERTANSKKQGLCLETPEFDYDWLKDEVLTDYVLHAAPSLVPLILMSYDGIETNAGSEEEEKDKRWAYLVEVSNILTGSSTDSNIAKVVRSHLHDIYAYVLPFLQEGCCVDDDDCDHANKMGKSILKFLTRLLQEDVISKQGAKVS